MSPVSLRFYSVSLEARMFSIIPQNPPNYQICIISRLPEYYLLPYFYLPTCIFSLTGSGSTQPPNFPETPTPILMQYPLLLFFESGQIIPPINQLTVK